MRTGWALRGLAATEARVHVGVLARPDGNGEAVLVQRDGRPAMAALSVAEYTYGPTP